MTRRNPDQRYVAAVYVAAMLMNTLDSTIVNVALATLGREFNVPAVTAPHGFDFRKYLRSEAGHVAALRVSEGPGPDLNRARSRLV
ncbi:MAG: hypothetical protein H0V00_07385 [Chloroflexia bacterium]|nr:hypothetical protein [Chloroflexia bacterium]